MATQPLTPLERPGSPPSSNPPPPLSPPFPLTHPHRSHQSTAFLTHNPISARPPKAVPRFVRLLTLLETTYSNTTERELLRYCLQTKCTHNLLFLNCQIQNDGHRRTCAHSIVLITRYSKSAQRPETQTRENKGIHQRGWLSCYANAQKARRRRNIRTHTLSLPLSL